MKQLIIGIYDGGYKYGIYELIIDKGTYVFRQYHKFDSEITKLEKYIGIDIKPLEKYIKDNLLDKYDSILIIDDSYLIIVK